MIEKLEKYIIKESVRYDSIESTIELPVYGVSNVDGITETQHKRSDDLSKYLVIRKDNFAYNPYRINVGSIGITTSDKEGLVSPAYVVFRTDENKLLPELLFDFLKSDEGLKQINKYARGTVRKALRFEDLGQVEMPIPDIVIQKKILEKKKGIDKNISDLIDLSKRQISEIQHIRRQILNERSNGTIKLSEYVEHESERVNQSNPTNRMIGVSNVDGITELTTGKNSGFENYKFVNKNSFIYNPMRVNIGSIALYTEEETCITSPDYIVFSTKNDYPLRALLYYLKSDYGLQEIAENVQGSVRQRLYFKNLCNINVPNVKKTEFESVEKLFYALEKIEDQIKKGFENISNLRKAKISDLFKY